MAPIRWTASRSVSLPWHGIVALTGVTLVSVGIAQVLRTFGMPVFIVAMALPPIAWSIFAPRSFAFFLLAVLIVIEPNAIDVTRPISDALYAFPASVEAELPLTIAPIEVLALITLVSLLVRRNPGRGERWRSLPLLTLGIPIMMVAGLGYGYVKGSDLALAYHEMRGLVFATVAFVIAIELAGSRRELAIRTLMWASTVAALALIARYLLLTRSGESGIPVEFAYAHESVLFLASALALSVGLWLSGGRGIGRWLLVPHSLLLLAAILATGRRSGTLVLLVIAVVLLLVLIRRAPLAGILIGVVAAACFVGYMGVFWNHEYGALAQPARAVRSQFDPTVRDESSDTYRLIERASILATLDSNPVFGVGFGNPFFTTQPLPSLQRFWPLQYYTPHQNVLWLWMKMGIVGISTVLGVWLIASGRAVRATWVAPRDGPFPLLPTVLLATFAGYIFFASVDVTFSMTRSAVPLGAALAVALTQLPAWTPTKAEPTAAREVEAPR